MIDSYGIVIGAMKSGTTSLFAYLAEHPEVAACSLKEPQFFSRRDRFSRGLDWYESLFDWDPARHRIALEASPQYTTLPKSPHTVERIAGLEARARLVYVMRDPLARIESHWTHGRAHDWPESRVPLTDGVDPQLLAVSRYATQLDAYRERFAAEDMLLLLFEDLVERPVEVVEQTCRFLDLDPAYRPSGLGAVHNPNRGRGAAPAWWHGLKRVPGLAALVRRLPAERRQAIRDRVSETVEEPARLPPEQRATARDALAEDVKRLRDDYGVDVSRWGF